MKKLMLALIATAAFSAPAWAKDALTIYTYNSFVADWGPGAKIKTAFEKTCDCDLTFVALGDGVAMLNRLKLEGKSTRADVVLGLDTNLTVSVTEVGLRVRAALCRISPCTRWQISPSGWGRR